MENNRNFNNYVKNDANFAKLYALTLAVLNLNKFPEGTFSVNGNAWLELADVWEMYSEFGSAGIFLDAIHRIMWGIPSDICEPEYEEIIRIVVEELLMDGDAFAAWDDYDACTTAMKAVGNDTSPWIEDADDYRRSIEHYHYLWDKMLWKIRYSKAKYLSEGINYKNAIHEYESAIKTIIPVAGSWDESYWYNERHIYDEIIKLYGIDYSNDYVEYSRILLLLMNHTRDKSLSDRDEAWFASNITRLPMSLAKVIWPEDTEDKMIKMFLCATEAAEMQTGNEELYAIQKGKLIHPVDVFEYSTIENSWLFAQVYAWYSDYHGDDEVLKEAKRRVFTVSMRK